MRQPGSAIGGLDSEHLRLLEVFDDIHAELSNDARQAELERLCGMLVAGTKKSFSDEEQWLARLDDRGLALHQSQHACFAMYLEHLVASSSSMSTGALCLLKDWLLDHVRSMNLLMRSERSVQTTGVRRDASA